MNKKNWFNKKPALMGVIYSLTLVLLILLAIVQVYRLWAQMDRPDTQSLATRQIEQDTQVSLLEPFDIYLTRDGARFARITELSGFYEELWTVSRTLINRMVRGGFTVTPIDERDLPANRAGIVFQYACPLPLKAIQELLLIEDSPIDVEEIILIPSQTRNEPVTLYLVDRDHQSFLRAESTVNVSSRAAQNFNSEFMECLEAAAPEYIDAHIRFPAMFLDGCYVRELESRSMYHIPQISISHVTEETLDVEAATAYVMHFFDHPDVARQVEEGEDFVWYADEKHTVRYDVHGLLQYVSTQDPSERKTLTLQEAYRLAYSFLQADLAFDKTLLQEIYLCDLEISEGGTYTFSWNYAYNHVPFSMSPETRQWTDLDHPIQIVVEGAQVRYYHRYLLDKTMEADAIFSIRETYIEALAGMLAGLPEETRIRAFGLEYGETEDKIVLFWKAETDQGQLSMPVEEVRT